MADIARYYDASKNPEGGHLPGVPLADISQEAFDAMPEWLQASVDAVGFYRKTAIRAAPATDAPSKPTAKAEKE